MAGFNVLATGQIREDTEIVISTKEQDGEEIVMIAQKLNVDQGTYSKGMFLKGAIKTDREGLEQMKVAIEKALAALN